MKPFKLQSVLDYRTLLRDMAQQKLCKTQKLEATLLGDLDREKTAFATLNDDFERHQQSGISPQDLMLYENHRDHLHKTIEELQMRIEAVRLEIEQQHQELCNADRDKKLLEKLKEKQSSAYKQEQRRKDSAEANEIAIQSHGR